MTQAPVRRRVDARRNLEAIVEAAARVLADTPTASMQQIGEAAGLHRATVHRHFASREDLITALRVRSLDECAERLEQLGADPGPTAGATLERALVALFEVGDRYRLFRYTSMTTPDTAHVRQPVHMRLRELVQAAQASGEVRTDVEPRELLLALGGMVWAYCPLVADRALTPDQAAALVRRLLGAPAA